MPSRKLLTKEEILALMVLILLAGSLVLAIIDPTIRLAFADLTKVALGAYVGLLIPRR